MTNATNTSTNATNHNRMCTTAPNTSTTSIHDLSKMLSLFRKSKNTSTVMANANTSETTLVSAPSKGEKTKRKPKRETEPYQSEFSGLSTLGGMPSLGGHSFLPPPSLTESNSIKKSTKKTNVAMVPSQPFKGNPRASYAQERLETAKGRQSFETFSTSVASATSEESSPTSSQRKLLKQHKVFFNNAFRNT